MKDFQVFNEAASVAQTNRVLAKFTPYLKSGAPIPPCAFASLTLEDAVALLKGFGGEIRGGPPIVVEFGNTDDLLEHLNREQIEQLMGYVNTVRRNLQDFFGDRFVTATPEQKQEIYPFFRDLINCQNKASWLLPEAGQLIYRGKTMSLPELNKLGKWKRDGKSWICTAPYKSQYPLQSWSYNYQKALEFAKWRTEDLRSQIGKAVKLGALPFDKPQYAGDDPAERAKFIELLKRGIRSAGATLNDVVLPVTVEYRTNAKEFLFNPDASDKIKLALKLFTKNTRERETVRISAQPITANYIIYDFGSDASGGMPMEALLNT